MVAKALSIMLFIVAVLLVLAGMVVGDSHGWTDFALYLLGASLGSLSFMVWKS